MHSSEGTRSIESDLLLAVYASVTSDEAFATVLRLLARRFDCGSAALFYVDEHRRDATITIAFGTLGNHDVQQLYARDFAAIDPAPGAMARLAIGEVASTDDLFVGPRLEAHAYFLEHFYHRVGLGGALGGPLANRSGQIGMVAVQRSLERAPFTPEDIEAFGSLIPHIVKAVDLRRAFFDIETRAAQMEDGLAVLKAGVTMFRPDGVLRHANPAARAVLGRGDGLFLDPLGRLHAADADDDRRLQMALNAAVLRSETSALVVRRVPDGGPGYLLRVAVARASGPGGALGPTVVLSDPERPLDDPVPILRMALGLSQPSAELVAGLMNGQNLASFAKGAGIAVNTAKYHLKTAFERSGVRRQAELVRLCTALTRDIA